MYINSEIKSDLNVLEVTNGRLYFNDTPFMDILWEDVAPYNFLELVIANGELTSVSKNKYGTGFNIDFVMMLSERCKIEIKIINELSISAKVKIVGDGTHNYTSLFMVPSSKNFKDLLVMSVNKFVFGIASFVKRM